MPKTKHESRNEASFNTVRAAERQMTRQLEAASKELETLREQKKVLVRNVARLERAVQDIADKGIPTGMSVAQEGLVNCIEPSKASIDRLARIRPTELEDLPA